MISKPNKSVWDFLPAGLGIYDFKIFNKGKKNLFYMTIKIKEKKYRYIYIYIYKVSGYLDYEFKKLIGPVK